MRKPGSAGNEMKHFICALQFLTILPLGKEREIQARRIVPLFPLAGLVIGLFVCLGDYLFSLAWPRDIVSLLDVLILALISGGLHLDGLGDTADGLLSHRSRERALEIMRDSRLGVMGILAIFFVLCMKWAGINHLSEHRMAYLLIIPAYSRGSLMFGIKFLRYGRTQGGMGTEFFSEKPPIVYLLISMLFPVFLSGWLGFAALWFNGLFMALTASILLCYRQKTGFVTGDMLGAMAEMEEAALFLAASIGSCA